MGSHVFHVIRKRHFLGNVAYLKSHLIIKMRDSKLADGIKKDTLSSSSFQISEKSASQLSKLLYTQCFFYQHLVK
jgi:hypothetical protein